MHKNRGDQKIDCVALVKNSSNYLQLKYYVAKISGLWVLNEIIQKKYPENMKKKIVGAVCKLPAK